jgi:transaldolase
MKIFLDTADVKIIGKHFIETGLIDGVTTNPSLIMKSCKQPDDVYFKLFTLGVKDVSMEVVSNTAKGMIEEADRLIGKFQDIVTIKVPCTREGLIACKELSDRGVRVNVTLIFSASQAILSAKAGATYISPFVGRVDDQRFGGCNLIKRIREVLPYDKCEILSASIRSVGDVEHSFAQGADICTMPPTVFEKMYDHILTEKGLQLFDIDYKKTLEQFGGI